MADVGTWKGVRRATRSWFLKGEAGTSPLSGQSVEYRGLEGHWGDRALSVS